MTKKEEKKKLAMIKSHLRNVKVFSILVRSLLDELYRGFKGIPKEETYRQLWVQCEKVVFAVTQLTDDVKFTKG